MVEWITKVVHDPVAFFTAILAIFTAVLAISTVWHVTGKAANAAKASADALLATERAYVFAEIRFAGFVSPDGTGNRINADISFWNYGKTPAVVTRIRAYIALRNEPPIELIDAPGADKDLPPGLGIAVNSAFPISVFTYATPRDQQDISSIERTAYCLGSVQYTDVLGKSHRTAFCWQYVPGTATFVLSRDSKLNFQT
jgi:hypothetical protein